MIAPAPSVATGGAAGSGNSNAVRRFAARVVDHALLDKWEPWSARRLRRWTPDADAAILIGHPFSPLVYAGKRLRAAGIPYVVDAGDPWVLTDPAPANRSVSLRRARRAEWELWQGAAGAVLTTPQQADRLRDLFAGLPTLVRPNGYDPLPAPLDQPRRAVGPELSIAHFGMLSTSRLDLRPLLRTLSDSGAWTRIVVAQFGDDFAGMLDGLPAGVEVERHPAYPWEQVVHQAAERDLAVVVGNVNPGQLPSKAVQYLTLPVPRLAVTEGSPADALAGYLRDKAGWLCVAPTDPAAASLIQAHLARDWSEPDLKPPPEEAWPAVAESICAFVDRCVAREGGR